MLCRNGRCAALCLRTTGRPGRKNSFPGKNRSAVPLQASRASDGTLLVTSYGMEGGTQTEWLISADGTSRQLCFEILEETTIQRVDLMNAERAFLTLEVPMEGEGYSVQATDVNGQATAARMISPSESGVFDLTTGQK